MTRTVTVTREHGAHGRSTGHIARELFVAEFGPPQPDRIIEWNGTTWRVIATYRHEHTTLDDLRARAEASR